ncbi:MAG: hypothetical protein PVG07_08760 [Acidobacteriota bacterium]|jgi:hypothetical protein
MMHSHRRTKALALVAALLLTAAAPALAAPAAAADGGMEPDAGLAPLSALWHRLVDPLVSLLGHPGAAARAGEGPVAIVDTLGPMADPDGTPSPDTEATGATAEIRAPSVDGPTG